MFLSSSDWRVYPVIFWNVTEERERYEGGFVMEILNPGENNLVQAKDSLGQVGIVDHDSVARDTSAQHPVTTSIDIQDDNLARISACGSNNII